MSLIFTSNKNHLQLSLAAATCDCRRLSSFHFTSESCLPRRGTEVGRPNPVFDYPRILFIYSLLLFLLCRGWQQQRKGKANGGSCATVTVFVVCPEHEPGQLKWK